MAPQMHSDVGGGVDSREWLRLERVSRLELVLHVLARNAAFVLKGQLAKGRFPWSYLLNETFCRVRNHLVTNVVLNI
jgi:hypothetical protein